MPFDGKTIPADVQVFVDALEVLRTDGWCQGRGVNAVGQRCIIGSIMKVLNGDARRTRIFMERQGFGFGATVVARFNDIPGRTFAEIEAWFEQKIAERMR